MLNPLSEERASLPPGAELRFEGEWAFMKFTEHGQERLQWLKELLPTACCSSEGKVYLASKEGAKWLHAIRGLYTDRYPSIFIGDGDHVLTFHILQCNRKGMYAYIDLRCIQEPCIDLRCMTDQRVPCID